MDPLQKNLCPGCRVPLEKAAAECPHCFISLEEVANPRHRRASYRAKSQSRTPPPPEVPIPPARLAFLEKEILKRNARFRAWKTFGVPIRGLWVRVQEGTTPPGIAPLYVLKMVCEACGEAEREIELTREEKLSPAV